MSETRNSLIAIVGEENVSDDSLSLEEYSKDNSFSPAMSPDYVVKVNDAKEVEALVKWANETKTPLVPISSSPPHYKGDTVPSVPQSIIVDLSGMKKILGINRRHRMVVIEPGVTYDELNAALAEEGMTVSMPLRPRAGKSVVASVLETEPRLNSLHQWCNLDPLRCVEVTWGDGNRMYTGEAGGSVMDLEEQWKEDKWQWEPAGPMMLDFYRLLTGAQGSMGIVTWASIRCEVMPQVQNGYLVPADNLEELMDFSYNVLKLRFSEEFFIMNGSQLARLMAEDKDEEKKLINNLPTYIAVIGIAGREFLPEERVSAQTQDISEIAQSHGLEMVPAIGKVTGEAVIEKASSTCSDNNWKDTTAGSHQDIFFATTLDKTPKFITEMERMAKEAVYRYDIGVYLQPENMGTSYHCSFTLPYDSKCKNEAQKVKDLYERASLELLNLGAYYFRPYGIWSKLQLNRDAESYKVLTDLKEIFDPNGIMNPGKLSNN
jgi:FAD/FMN-containing dehydrogenase